MCTSCDVPCAMVPPQDLLRDRAVVVRVVAILGVCRVISTFWDITPSTVIKTFLQELVENLAWDTASINVRVAVLQVCVCVCVLHVCVHVCWCGCVSWILVKVLVTFDPQGLCVVLKNRTSHHIMKRVLPFLQPCIHDTSEKVRLAFLDLLFMVKGLGTVKVWAICSVEHLLGKWLPPTPPL